MALYHEFVIKGHDRDLIPYIAGFMVGAKLKGVYFAAESGLHVHALRERIRHLGEVEHVICKSTAAKGLRAALAKAAPRYHFEIKEVREVAGANYHFKVETPSRKVAELVKGVVAKRVRGVKIIDFAPTEELDPSAKGAEIYSPTHHYMFRAHGEVTGDVAGVIAIRQVLSVIDFVKCDEITLIDA